LQTNIVADNYSSNIINGIYSGITFAPNEKITYYGLDSLNNYNEWVFGSSIIDYVVTNLGTFGAIINTEQILNNINILYEYKIIFTDNIVVSGNTYNLLIMNGSNANKIIKLSNPFLYTNDITFLSQYKLKSTDLKSINQITNYSFTSNHLGALYTLLFDSTTNINLNIIDNIFLLSANLVVERIINNHSCNVIIPNTVNIPTNNFVFELRYYVRIKTLNNNNITFFNPEFYYSNNHTFIIIDTVFYPLTFSSGQYGVDINNIVDYNCTIVTFITLAN
jgi:hypothetical protein